MTILNGAMLLLMSTEFVRLETQHVLENGRSGQSNGHGWSSVSKERVKVKISVDCESR